MPAVRPNSHHVALALVLVIFAAVMAYMVPRAAAAPATQTTSSQKADVTDDYLQIIVDVTRAYKPRLNRAAKVKLTNPNPSNTVRVKFQNDDFKWMPKHKVFVPPNSTVVVKINEREVYFSISVIVNGNKLPYQGGSLDLTRTD